MCVSKDALPAIQKVCPSGAEPVRCPVIAFQQFRHAWVEGDIMLVITF